MHEHFPFQFFENVPLHGRKTLRIYFALQVFAWHKPKLMLKLKPQKRLSFQQHFQYKYICFFGEIQIINNKKEFKRLDFFPKLYFSKALVVSMYVCLFVVRSLVCLLACLFVCLFVCLFACLLVCLFVCFFDLFACFFLSIFLCFGAYGVCDFAFHLRALPVVCLEFARPRRFFMFKTSYKCL